MSKLGISTKQMQIDKAQATVTVVIGLACLISVGCLVSTRALLAKRSYQARVVSEKEKALKQLEDNKESVNKLRAAYQGFVEESTNGIGGLATGTGERDGDNAKITLDALPSKYDFPALTTSVEKLLLQKNFKIKAITGSDDELGQKDKSAATPEVVEMPVQWEIVGSYDSMIELLDVYERSIRPFQFDELVFKASKNELEMQLKARTYYLPEKKLTIDEEVVK